MSLPDDPGTGRAASESREEPPWLERARRAGRVDLRPEAPPSNIRWVLATLASVAVSLALDALAVHAAKAWYPNLRHFSHFRPADYGALTVVGILLAAGGWAVLVRMSSAAHWLFFRLAIVSTVILWIPDGVLFALGEPTAGVVTLMVMHLFIALVTYNLLVHVAPPRRSPSRSGGLGGAAPPSLRLSERLVRRVWSAMALVVALELVLGVVVIVSVPFRRPAAILPTRGIWIYAAHGAVGIALGFGALAVLVLSTMASRIGRIGAVMGAVGVVLGVAGGACATYQQTRLLGMGVMLVGVVVAGVGYLAPSLEALGKAEAAKAEVARAALAGSRGRPARDPGGVPAGADGVSSNGHDAPAG